MMALILAAVISAGEVTQGQDDLKDPKVGPDATHVAICIGSDINGAEIKMLDRLCLNGQAVVQTVATIDNLDRERKDLVAKLNEVNKALYESKLKEGVNPIVVTVIAIGTAAITAAAVAGGLKAAGKI